MAYDPDKRVSECPDEDASQISRIEIDFGLSVYLTQAQQRKLVDLIEEITKQPWNAPEEGVHWLSGSGSKPRFSQVDALFLGKEVDPNAPISGEPEFDNEILVFETHAREFVTQKERERVLNERKGIGLCSVCREPQFETRHGTRSCKNGHSGAEPTREEK